MCDKLRFLSCVTSARLHCPDRLADRAVHTPAREPFTFSANHPTSFQTCPCRQALSPAARLSHHRRLPRKASNQPSISAEECRQPALAKATNRRCAHHSRVCAATCQPQLAFCTRAHIFPRVLVVASPHLLLIIEP